MNKFLRVDLSEDVIHYFNLSKINSISFYEEISEIDDGIRHWIVVDFENEKGHRRFEFEREDLKVQAMNLFDERGFSFGK